VDTHYSKDDVTTSAGQFDWDAMRRPDSRGKEHRTTYRTAALKSKGGIFKTVIVLLF